MGFRIVDLSQEIFSSMPVYPGNQRTGVFPNKTHAETAKAYANSPSGHTSTTNCLIMSDHGPTHVDAFYHIDKDGETIDQLDLSWFYTEAICLDLSRFCSTEDWMQPADLEEASAKANLEVPDKGSVLIWTGRASVSGFRADSLWFGPFRAAHLASALLIVVFGAIIVRWRMWEREG